MQSAVNEYHLVRRSRMETTCEVLQVIESGSAKITHIMYHANLSWRVMNELLETCQEQGLLGLNSNDGKATYHITEKGRRLLSQFRSIRNELQLKQ